MSETRKSPLWKNVIVLLEYQGVDYSTVIKAEWLEKELELGRNTPQFGASVHQIRCHFEQQGMYLTCRDQHGEQYYFVPPENNYAVMQMMQARAIRALKRGVILGTNTPLHTLSPENRKRHEKHLEQMATRAALMMRQSTVLKLLNGKQLPPAREKLTGTGT